MSLHVTAHTYNHSYTNTHTYRHTHSRYEQGSEVPPFQIRSPLIQIPPVIQGSKVPPLSFSILQCAEDLNPFSPFMAIPTVIFPNPPFLARLFRQYRPNEIPDKHKNKLMWQIYFFIFRKLKNNIKCSFMNKTFIIIILSIHKPSCMA